MNPHHRRHFRPRCEPLDDRCLLSVVTPAQMRHAYGVDATRFISSGGTVQGNGAGQTIAIVVAYHDPYLARDLNTFDANYGLARTSLVQLNRAGVRTDDGWAGEESMDVEWVHAMAPAASIVVVEARSDSIDDLMAAVNVARLYKGVSVVSMSWGGPEFDGETSYDSVFTTVYGHRGVTFVTASGDSGAQGGAEWPSSSPNVVSVGGTSLLIDTAGNHLGESAWNGSGGGTSVLETEPAYQASVQGSGQRTTPDVSLVADPYTGVEVYSTAPSSGQGSWGVYGGTSLSAQLFGAVVAIANQGRILAGKGTLDGPSQTLPTLYATSASDLRDVASGSNGYPATFGYDLATGLGTPYVPSLARDLVRLGNMSIARATRAATTPRNRAATISLPNVSTATIQAIPTAASAVELGAIVPPDLDPSLRHQLPSFTTLDRAIDDMAGPREWI